ncbi:hypothetical protein HDU89_004329 [Geranomyces variabilis]|nr:hypothetical protein HDU89_004329 [Geranomyces variabilis]
MVPADELSAKDFIHIREIDEARVAELLAKISETGTYDNTKAVVVARNPAEAQLKFSILGGAHRVEAVSRFNAAQTEEGNKITVLPAIVLRANMPTAVHTRPYCSKT